MSYLNHIIFTLFAVTLCASPLNAQAATAALTPAQQNIGFYYFPKGNDNTVNSFEMSFTVNDPQIKEAYFKSIYDLQTEIEYEKVSEPGLKQVTQKQSPKSFKNVGDYFFGEVKLNNLQPNTTYRARIRFFKKNTDSSITKVGHTSAWYYTTTTGTHVNDQTQALRLLKKIHDNHALNAPLTRQKNSISQHAVLCTTQNALGCVTAQPHKILESVNNPVLIARKNQITLVITQ